MKILIICNYFQRQIPYAESEIARNLALFGHQVEIFTGNKYFPFPHYKFTVEKVLGKRQTYVGRKKEMGIYVERKRIILEIFARSLFLGVADKIKNFQPEIVIVFGLSTPACIQVALARKKYRFRFIGVDSHLLSELYLKNVYFKRFCYFLFRLFFAKLIDYQIDKIIATQEGTRIIIDQYYGLSRKAALISHGSNLDLFKPDLEKRKLWRKKLHLKKGDFVIIHTGKVIPSKGTKLLMTAFSNLVRKYSNIYLLIVGDGSETYKKECLQNLNTDSIKNLMWVGFKKYQFLPTYYNMAEVAVWPLQESLAMLDAAACGLPLVVNDQIGARERLANNNALLYKRDNVQDLAQKIEFLYLHPVTRIAMGKRSRKLMAEKFSWPSRALEYINL